MPHGVHCLMQASDELEMNEWISLINCASAFKTAGIRMRGSAMNKDQAVLAGAAAAASHQRVLRGSDAQEEDHVDPKIVFGEAVEFPSSSDVESRPLRLQNGAKNVPVEVVGPQDTALSAGEQLEEVFGVVKAELAAGRGTVVRSPMVLPATDGGKTKSNGVASSSQASRAEAIQVRPLHRFRNKLEPD